MKKSLILLVGLLVSLASIGQSIIRLPDQIVYPGNPFVLNINLSRLDSAATSSAVLRYDLNGGVVEQPNQPTVTRYGRLLTISWTSIKTKALPINQRLWLEVKAGSVVKQGIFLFIGRLPPQTTTPGSSTYTAPSYEFPFSLIKDLPAYLTKTAIDGKVNTTTYQAYVDANDAKNTAQDNLIASKLSAQTLDPVPTVGSANPAASGGIFSALAGKMDFVFSVSSTQTILAQAGNPKLIFEVIGGVLTVYIYAPTASPTLQKFLIFN